MHKKKVEVQILDESNEVIETIKLWEGDKLEFPMELSFTSPSKVVIMKRKLVFRVAR